jgi:hypothetical protein
VLMQSILTFEGDLSMMKPIALVAATTLAVWTLPAFGQEGSWSPSQEDTSHGLASAGWQFLGELARRAPGNSDFLGFIRGTSCPVL